MALSSFFDDYPILPVDNGCPRRRRNATRPFVICPILNSLENQMDQSVGQLFKRLPAMILDLEDEFENKERGEKRKLRSGAVSEYEPKSKVVVTNNDNKFKISLNMSNYHPEKISVKVVDDKLTISAKHEAKGKDVYEFYEMHRSFDLPENVDPNAATSRLSANGELTVEVPIKALPEPTVTNIPVAVEGQDQQAVESSETQNKEINS